MPVSDDLIQGIVKHLTECAVCSRGPCHFLGFQLHAGPVDYGLCMQIPATQVHFCPEPVVSSVTELDDLVGFHDAAHAREYALHEELVVVAARRIAAVARHDDTEVEVAGGGLDLCARSDERGHDQPAVAGGERAFKEFLAQHPTDPLAGSAQYWLGETYYAQNDYKRAAANFLQGYKKYPGSRRAPDSLLKLGISLNRLGQSEQACAAYAAVSAEYPKAVDARKRAQAEAKRAGCAS